MELKSVYLLKNIKACKDINNKLEGDFSLAISGREDIDYEQSECNTMKSILPIMLLRRGPLKYHYN